MGKWKFTAPDGTAYTVEGEDEDEAYAALQNKIKEDVHAEYENLPLYQKPIQAAGDIARIASNLVTGGKRDEWANYLGGGTPEEEKYKTEQARERAGSAALGAEILPMLAIPELAALRSAPALGVGATEGAAFGGLQAAAHDEPVIPGMLAGGATGGVVGAGSAVNSTLKNLPKSVGLPAAKEIGKLRLIPHGVTAASGLAGAGMVPGSPIGTMAATAAGVGIPLAGMLARSAYKAGKTALGKAKKIPTEHWDPEIRKLLTSLGIGASGQD